MIPKKVLTISVAAYNIENYIDKLMTSILIDGIIEKLQILIIDDGSKDATNESAQKYVELYPNSVSVITKTNGGHGSTINVGIENAAGLYFRALDGDDWIDSDSLVKLVNILENEVSDVVVTPYWIISQRDNLQIKSSSNIIEKVYSQEEYIKYHSTICYHSLIYRTDFIKSHHPNLDEHCFYVDTEYVYLPLIYAQSIRYIELPIYCYRIGNNEQSVSYVSRINNINSSLIVSKRLVAEYIKNQGNIAVNNLYLEKGMAHIVLWHLTSLASMKYSKENKRIIIEFYEEIQQNIPEIGSILLKYNCDKNIFRIFYIKNPARGYFLYQLFLQLKQQLRKKSLRHIHLANNKGNN